MTNMLSLDSQDMICIYLALGHMYTDLNDFAVMPDFDMMSLEQQEFALHKLEKTRDLYSRFTDHLEKMQFPVRSLFDMDMGATRPKKDV